MMIRRALLAALTAAAVVATAAPPVAARPPEPAPVRSAALDWRPCGTAEEPDATECATLDLPVDWADPGGARFGLAVARRPTTDRAARIGTLIFGPGGPGDSGVNRLRTGSDRFSAELRRRFDIVSFDPRGVGGSNPVRCAPAAGPAPYLLTDQAGFDRTVAANRAWWQSCRELTGPLFDHADSGSTVRDLDALRAALGERTLTFHGSSYGTLLGAQYAERYPARVRAIVLESVVDHSRPTAGAFLTSQAWALQDAFDAFVAWCAGREECGADVRAGWAELIGRADRGQLGLTTFELVVLAHKDLMDANYPALADRIGNLLRGGIETPRVPIPVLAVFCADWALPVRDFAEYRRLLDRAATVAPDVRHPVGAFALAACLGWPRPVANPQHRLSVHTRTPLLLINSVHDPATGYNWATEVARQLGRHGVLLTYAGAGHGSYGSSDCMRDTVDAYLIAGTVPRRGTVCPAA